MLELKNVGFSIPSPEGMIRIIDSISLTVPDGDLFVLTGPNGGGKTTLAKLIMGLEQPTEGQILWNGEDVTALDVTERAKRGISYGFQQPPRFKGITVGTLLGIAAGNDTLPTEEACAYLRRVGLCAEDYLKREVDASLSGGELKRIEIATILARRSGLMILDEPEAGIDLWSFTKLTETFGAIHADRNATMLLISHQERIISLADKVVIIAHGKLVNADAPEKLFPSLAGHCVGGKCDDCRVCHEEN